MKIESKRSLTTGVPTVAAGICLMALGSLHSAEAVEATTSAPVKPAQVKLTGKQDGIWEGDIGAGFERSTAHAAAVMGVAPGLSVFGSPVDHNLALAGISYGKMWGETKAKDHWWRGNFEWRVEMLAGGEFSPSAHYFVGLTPHLRYNFATGTRWIPFVGFGSGVSLTSIGEPDLGGTFQFNTQVSVGVNYFIKRNLSLCLETRAMHVSSAGISQPNAGMNNILVLAGVNWYY